MSSRQDVGDDMDSAYTPDDAIADDWPDTYSLSDPPSSDSDTDDDDDQHDADTGGSNGWEASFAAEHVHGKTGVVSVYKDAHARQEKLRRAQIRQHVEACEAELTQAKTTIASLEQQQVASQTLLGQLGDQLDDLEARLVTATPPQDVHVLAQVRRVQAELDAQQEADALLSERLHAARRSCSKLELSRNSFADLAQQVASDEAQDAKEEAILSRLRADKERAMAVLQVRQQQRAAALQRRQAERDAAEQARLAQVAAKTKQQVSGYLAQTHAKQQRHRDAEQARLDAERDRKVRSLLTLKQEQERVAELDQRRAVEQQKKRQRKADRQHRERAAILAAGGNPDAVFLQRRRDAEAALRKKQAADARKTREIEIVQRLMDEEERQQGLGSGSTGAGGAAVGRGRSSSTMTRSRRSVPSSSLEIGPDIAEFPDGTDALEPTQPFGSAVGGGASAVGGGNGVGRSSGLTFDTSGRAAGGFGGSGEDADDPLAAEFAAGCDLSDEGRWDTVDDFAQPVTTGLWGDAAGAGVGGSSSRAAGSNGPAAAAALNITVPVDPADASDDAESDELQMLSTTLTQRNDAYTEKLVQAGLRRQRDTIVQRQVVAGREFKGPGFSCKPERVVFQDFEVGQTHRKKLVLTNISYSVNSFKVLQAQSPAIEYEYTPSGGVSAGLGTDLVVLFTPTANEDFVGTIDLLAHTGPVSIPLECLTKKCKVSLSTRQLDCGKVFLGDAVTKTIQITNDGALPTGWKVLLTSNEGADSELEPVVVDGATEGLLEGYSKATVKFRFYPTVVGEHTSTALFSFTDLTTEPLEASVVGVCDDVPVFLEASSVDLRICLYGHTYAAPITVVNRLAATAQVSFRVPPGLQQYLQVIPKTAVVPPKGKTDCRVQLTPSAQLFDDCTTSDLDTGRLSTEIVMQVANQSLPGVLAVEAHATPSDIDFSLSEVDFGCVSVYESAIVPVTLTNKSALPQTFGFVGLPDHLSVQPDDGFGTLLPFESLTCDLIFSPPRKPGDDDDKAFKWVAECRWTEGLSHKIRCKGLAVVPGLRFVSAHVQFRATAYGDESVASVLITNPSARAQTFDFAIDKSIPVLVSPSSATLQPGEKRRLRVCFKPQKPAHPAPDTAQEGGTDTQIDAKDTQVPLHAPAETKTSNDGSEQQQPTENTPGLTAVRNVWDLPCVVLPAQSSKTASRSQLAREAIYLHVDCPAVPPAVHISSGLDDDAGGVHFGVLAVGERRYRELVVQNNTDVELQLSAGALDPHGPFRVVRALRPLAPHGTLAISVCFEPDEHELFADVLELHCEHMTVRVPLSGDGVQPTYQVSPSQLDVGHCVVGAVTKTPITIKNTSPFPLTFQATFEGDQVRAQAQAPDKDTPLQHIPHGQFVMKFDPETGLAFPHHTDAVGAINYSSVPAFSCSPAFGTVQPDSEQPVEIHFTPDHPSASFRDCLHVSVTSEGSEYKVPVTGCCWPQLVYVQGFDAADPPVEESPLHPMSLPPTGANNATDQKQSSPSVLQRLVSFKYSLSEDVGGDGVSRVLRLGVSRAMQADKKARPTGEFTIEALAASAVSSGFGVESVKGSLSGEEATAVAITFQPPPESRLGLGQTIETHLVLHTKLETTTTYDVTLRAYITR
eukprot:m.235455 g.235455  ORF g.235455 m.235455 type:complete len:1628 (+) comp18926_c0_seq5:189-5072(+)